MAKVRELSEEQMKDLFIKCSLKLELLRGYFLKFEFKKPEAYEGEVDYWYLFDFYWDGCFVENVFEELNPETLFTTIRKKLELLSRYDEARSVRDGK